MGIAVQFDPELALRNIAEFKQGNRKLEECIPEKLEAGKTYSFLKTDQRNYYLWGEIALIETKGKMQWSKPVASIIILESTHFLENGKLCTKGKYKVIEVFNDKKVHFECTDKIGTRYDANV